VDNWLADENREKRAYVTNGHIASVLMGHTQECAEDGVAGQGRKVGARPECPGCLANDSKTIAGELLTARRTEDGNPGLQISADIWKGEKISRTGRSAELDYEKKGADNFSTALRARYKSEFGMRCHRYRTRKAQTRREMAIEKVT
jgi:hypothetical protein